MGKTDAYPWNTFDAPTLDGFNLLIARLNALHAEVKKLAAEIDQLRGAEPEGRALAPMERMPPRMHAVLQGVRDTIAHIADTESAGNRERLMVAIAPLSELLAIDTILSDEVAGEAGDPPRAGLISRMPKTDEPGSLFEGKRRARRRKRK